MPNSLGSRSIVVVKQAGRQVADEMLVFYAY